MIPDIHIETDHALLVIPAGEDDAVRVQVIPDVTRPPTWEEVMGLPADGQRQAAACAWAIAKCIGVHTR